MIIKELYLEHFGQFHHKKIELEEGLNVIYGENEAGKTTIHTFIRGMLFGLERSRGKGAKQDTYSKYEPWDMPGSYSGSMRFEIGGLIYRMDREFRTDKKTVRVLCEDTGKLLTPEEQTELFGGLYEESYYNTVSVSQLGGKTDEDLGTVLKQYAANLTSTKHAEMNLKKASGFLKDRKKQMIKENQVDQKSVWKEAWIELDGKERACEEERKKIEEKMDSQAEREDSLKEDYRRELSEEQREKEELKSMQAECRALCDRQLFLAKEQKDLQMKIGEKREQIGRMMQALEAAGLSSLDDVLEKTQKEEKKLRISLWSLGAFLLTAAASIYLLLFTDLLKAGLICFGATTFFLLLFIFLSLHKSKVITRRLEELETCKDVCVRCAASQNEFEQLRRKNEEDEETTARVNQSIRSLEEDIQKKIASMPEKAKETGRLLQEQRQQARQLSWEMEQNASLKEALEEERQDIRERLEKIEKAETEIRGLELAAERLEVIGKKIRESFGGYLNERASYYLRRITGGKYGKLVIDDDMQIFLHTDRRILEVSQLSKGTLEQAYLSLRLAAADIIFEQEHKPILLDDAFVSYDNKRMAMTLDSLADEVEQAVIFTCHTREKAVLDNHKIPYHFVALAG